MEFVPVLQNPPPEAAGIRVSAQSFREATHLITDCLELRHGTASGEPLAQTLAGWEAAGRPVRREDGVVATLEQWRYHFDAKQKDWLRRQMESIEHELVDLGYPPDNCNQLDGLPRYDGDAIVIMFTGVNAANRDVPTIALGMRLVAPGGEWVYVSGGATVPTVVHPTLVQAKDRAYDLIHSAGRKRSTASVRLLPVTASRVRRLRPRAR